MISCLYISYIAIANYPFCYIEIAKLRFYSRLLAFFFI